MLDRDELINQVISLSCQKVLTSFMNELKIEGQKIKILEDEQASKMFLINVLVNFFANICDLTMTEENRTPKKIKEHVKRWSDEINLIVSSKPHVDLMMGKK